MRGQRWIHAADMTQAGSVLVVDDQAERASALVAALDDPHHSYEITPEAPDIEAVLGPDSPDCVICHVELLNVSWLRARVMRNFDVQVPVLAVSDHRHGQHDDRARVGRGQFFCEPRGETRSGQARLSAACIIGSCSATSLSPTRVWNGPTPNSATSRILEQDQAAGRQVQKAMFPRIRSRQGIIGLATDPALALLDGDFTDYFEVVRARWCSSWRCVGPR